MPRKNWSETDWAELVRLYPVTPTRKLAEHFGCSIRSIYCMAQKLKLYKSPDYLTSKESGRIIKNEHRGLSSEFKPGHTPPNKGVKGWQAGGRAEQTKWKLGHKPHNYQPIGTLRVNADGYLERKITSTGHKNKDWVCVHHLLWKEQHGDIPKKHVLIFKNGDKTDLNLDNLELITMAKNLERNTIHRFPKKLKQIMQAKASLTRRINQAQREQRKTTHEKQD